jgi:hypothetical protein
MGFFEGYELFPDPKRYMFLLAGLNLLLVALFGLYWTGLVLYINRMRVEMISWFLDIPIPRVSLLSRDVIKFMKDFETVKAMTERGLREDEIVLANAARRQPQREEDRSNSRKALIKSYRQQNICSNFRFSFLLFYLLFGCLAVTSLANGVVENVRYNKYSQFVPMLIYNAEWVSCSHTMQMVYRYNQLSPPQEQLKPRLFEQQLTLLMANMRNIFWYLPSIIDPAYRDLYFHSYYLNLCELSQYPGCEGLFAGSLIIGLQSLYYVHHYSEVNYGNLSEAAEHVLRPLFQKLIRASRAYARYITGVYRLVYNVLNVTFFVVVTLLFLTLWQYYIYTLNGQLNQIIRILNMIPLDVILSSDREVKSFIKWLLRESSSAADSHDSE